MIIPMAVGLNAKGAGSAKRKRKGCRGKIYFGLSGDVVW